MPQGGTAVSVSRGHRAKIKSAEGGRLALTSQSRPFVPAGTGMLMMRSLSVCVQEYLSRSAPLPPLGSAHACTCIEIACHGESLLCTAQHCGAGWGRTEALALLVVSRVVCVCLCALWCCSRWASSLHWGLCGRGCGWRLRCLRSVLASDQARVLSTGEAPSQPTTVLY